MSRPGQPALTGGQTQQAHCEVGATPSPLTVGPTLPDEVPVEPMVNVDLHIVHPVDLWEEHRAGQQRGALLVPGTCWLFERPLFKMQVSSPGIPASSDYPRTVLHWRGHPQETYCARPHPQAAPGALTRSLTMLSICSWATLTSSVGPSRVILSSPSVNSMCTYQTK